MRREWIEIGIAKAMAEQWGKSPSMRREWVEIGHGCVSSSILAVSLHAEGVD